MRTKHLDKKRELENAFSFGQHKNENVLSPNKTDYGLAKQNGYRMGELDSNVNGKGGKYGNQNRKGDSQREPLGKLRNNGVDYQTSKEDELLKKFEDYERKFVFGKVIQSETFEESVETIIEPLQNELMLIKAEKAMQKASKAHREQKIKQAEFAKNPVPLYNPSIQEIKKKYGYNHQPKIPSQKTPNKTTTPLNTKYYNQRLKSDIQKYQNNNNDRYQRSPTLKTTQNTTSYTTFNKLHPNQQKERHHKDSRQCRDRIRTFDALETKTSKIMNSTTTSNQFEQSNDWVLKSINDLDSKISQKMNKIIPELNRPPLSKRY